MLALSNSEIEFFDAELEPKLEWAKSRTAEAEQLALDCARLLSCTEDRLGQIRSQGFFKRCWNSFSGKTAELERVNTADLIHMQKASLRFITLLQERQLMLAHSMLSLKNNLLTLAIKETETRRLLASLAENTLRRFKELENRVDQLEISQNLQGWLLTLEDRDYEDTYPTPYLRMFRIVNDFYTYKDDNWNYNDMLFMRKALRTVGIDPKLQVSMSVFIDGLVDEIQLQGFETFSTLVLDKAPVGLENYGYFALENISSQVVSTVHGLHTQYTDKKDVIEELSEELSISQEAALKRILSRYVAKLNVDMDCQLPMSDLAAEMLGGLRLSAKLSGMNASPAPATVATTPKIPCTPQVAAIQEEKTDTQDTNEYIDLSKQGKPKWVVQDFPLRIESIYEINGEYILVPDTRWDNDAKKMRTKDFEEFEETDKDFRSGCVIVNGVWFCKKRDDSIIYCSYDGSTWDKLRLPEYHSGHSIDYKSIHFAEGKWVIFGRYIVSHEHTVSGIIFDSTKTTACYYGLILEGDSLDNIISKYDTHDDFWGYNVDNFCFSGNTYIATCNYFTRSDDAFVIVSSDGSTWKKTLTNCGSNLKLRTLNHCYTILTHEKKYESSDGLSWAIKENEWQENIFKDSHISYAFQNALDTRYSININNLEGIEKGSFSNKFNIMIGDSGEQFVFDELSNMIALNVDGRPKSFIIDKKIILSANDKLHIWQLK